MHFASDNVHGPKIVVATGIYNYGDHVFVAGRVQTPAVCCRVSCERPIAAGCYAYCSVASGSVDEIGKNKWVPVVVCGKCVVTTNAYAVWKEVYEAHHCLPGEPCEAFHLTEEI